MLRSDVRPDRAALAPGLVRRPRTAPGEPEWDPAARRVLEHRQGPLRVVGGPGTGKTSVLLAAVARRLRAGDDPERTLVLVGSRRAAGELRERLVDMTHRPGDARTTREPLVRTVHSYAFGVLRLHAARHGDPPPRLLASAEQDAVVRDLLVGELCGPEHGGVPDSGWPNRLRPALGLPGFAAELRELLLRAAERGLGPEELAELGQRHDVPEWRAAGRFFRSYEQVILLRGAAGRGAPQATAPALDAAELVAAALDALASDRDLLDAERARVRHLVVDDAQDLDPQQMELVRALGATAQSVLLAGDPDQAVLNFRGADPEGLRAVEAETVVLPVDHRSAPAVRAAVTRLAARLPGTGPGRRRAAPGDADPAPDDPAPDGPEPADPSPAAVDHEDEGASDVGTVDEGCGSAGPAAADAGSVQVKVFGSAAQEAGWVADQLRRAHLTDGVPWSRMAVLARSTRRSLPTLRRALLAAGVPIAAPTDELPLARQPAVVPLLMVLRCAARPDQLDADAANALLTSPLGSADPMRLRRLRRGLLRLHAATRAAPDDEAEAERSGSDPLLVQALRAAALGRPDPLVALPPHETAPLRRVGTLLAIAGDAIRDGESAEEVLWRVWQACGLGPRLRDASGRGGPVGAAADRDLDAVLALFDAAARHADRLPGAAVASFTEYLADQQLPGESLAPRAPQGEAVALLTAHAARGREWDVVAVPGVQEGSWPDLRLRGSLLGNERLVDLVAGVAEPVGATVSRVAPLLAEERRLFYVACSRARHALLVSAVQGEDEQPSRFLDELDPVPATSADRPVYRPGRSLVLAELVGELRRAVCAPAAPEDPAREERRHRAAVQLARLAEAGVPGAHPDDWYGLAPLSTDAPLREPGEVVPVSPSDVEKIVRCPLRWVLERHGGGEVGALAAVTGSLVHALVQADAAGADPSELEHALRSAWSRLDAGAPWFGRRELERVRGMLAAFDGWVRSSRAEGLRLVAVEQQVQLDISGDGPGLDVVGDEPAPRPGEEPAGDTGSSGPWLRLRLRGRVDRLEVDAAGRPVVVDVKTGKTAVSARAAAEHPQLAVYQLAAALGAFGSLLEPGVEPGGARLVYLADRKSGGQAKEPVQPPLGEEELAGWRAVLLQCAEETSEAQFVARVGPDCDRCPVRTSCPLSESGRPVPDA
ncbi:ATP-dependent helicase [Pseudonocardia kunmingensis]|uniref:DNA 3'-5' helicase n=1 Tax=Pseudonocardia kunmingensis TaxID=630975 RepID=A0A543CYT1_9PSEU|nr:superfamily I DNA/RNA helicase [Pseudonocardia kunmingensis]